MTDPGRFDDAKLFCPVSGLNATWEETRTVQRLLWQLLIMNGFVLEVRSCTWRRSVASAVADGLLISMRHCY